MLPSDGHVHSEWSWDAPLGSMRRTCERAIEIGLPSIAFTEHVDLTPWTVRGGWVPAGARVEVTEGVLVPPPLDVPGYLECLRLCRESFPDLRILGGVELSEPHWYKPEVAKLLGLADFDRVLGSVHSMPSEGGGFLEINDAYQVLSAAELVRFYLAEALRLVNGSDAFEVLAHIDYPIRHWPAEAGPYDASDFEDEYREVLRALAGTGRILEVNTRVPLDAQVVRWWYEAGGHGVAFGSDTHRPDLLAHDFAAAAAMAEAAGFHPGREPHDIWTRF